MPQKETKEELKLGTHRLTGQRNEAFPLPPRSTCGREVRFSAEIQLARYTAQNFAQKLKLIIWLMISVLSVSYHCWWQKQPEFAQTLPHLDLTSFPFAQFDPAKNSANRIPTALQMPRKISWPSLSAHGEIVLLFVGASVPPSLYSVDENWTVLIFPPVLFRVIFFTICHKTGRGTSLFGGEWPFGWKACRFMATEEALFNHHKRRWCQQRRSIKAFGAIRTFCFYLTWW